MDSPLHLQHMMQEAEHRTDLQDWGGAEWHEDDFRHYVGALVESLVNEAALHRQGHQAAHERLLNMLISRLQLVEDRKRIAAISAGDIRRPIIALGMPRAGSTFLHGLLAQDPASRAPHTWEITFPSPPPTRAGFANDPRIEQCQAALRRQGWLREELLKIHPYDARLVDECGFIYEYSGIGYYHAYWNVPSYAALAGAADYVPILQLHRRVLQHLQVNYGGERWVLKAPGAINYLDALFAVYPDICVIQNHRDPIKTIPSFSSTLVELHRTFSDEVPDVREVTRFGLAQFGAPVQAAIAFREQPDMERRFFDCHFTEMVRDPMAMVRRIYGYFDLELTAAAERTMRDWLAHDQHVKGSRHRYRLDDYGLTEADVEQHFGDYLDHYRIERERA